MSGTRHPTEAELRRGEAATWGMKPEPSVIASNLRWRNKNTLKAAVDLAIPKWRITFKGCLWHEKNGKEWINFPSREWLDRDAKRKFADLVAWSDRELSDRFQAAALAAVHAVAGSAPR